MWEAHFPSEWHICYHATEIGHLFRCVALIQAWNAWFKAFLVVCLWSLVANYGHSFKKPTFFLLQRGIPGSLSNFSGIVFVVVTSTGICKSQVNWLHVTQCDLFNWALSYLVRCSCLFAFLGNGLDILTWIVLTRGFTLHGYQSFGPHSSPHQYWDHLWNLASKSLLPDQLR